MVKRERPVPVLVLALTGLLLGGLGLAGAGAALSVCWASGGAGSPALTVPLAPAAAEHCRAFVPGFRALETLLPATALVLAVLVLASGLVLLGMHAAARTAAIATAATVLLVLTATALYVYAVLLPAVETWREEGFRRNVISRQVSDSVPAEAQWVSLLLLIGGLIFFVHAVATLAVLYAPAVAEAFASSRRASKGEEVPCPHDCSTATS